MRILENGQVSMGLHPVSPLNFKMNSAISLLVQYSDYKSGESIEELDKKMRKKIYNAQRSDLQVTLFDKCLQNNLNFSLIDCIASCINEAQRHQYFRLCPWSCCPLPRCSDRHSTVCESDWNLPENISLF